MNNTLGIYFGPQLISIVETKGNKPVNYAQVSKVAASPGETLEEKVPLSEKLIVLLRDELTKSEIETREAIVSISGKDLIVRTFEMPILPRHELDAAINFEAKKYIPFKIEDLISDFQYKLDKGIKKNRVLFVGIKKETLDSYLHILSQLGIKVKSIEYSAFSILRLLKLASVKEKGIIGVVNIDLAQDDEANFVVTEDGFPLFSRDISPMSIPEEAVNNGQNNHGAILEKLRREIQISLDYYERKFIGKNVSKIFFITDPRHRDEFGGLAKELNLGVNFVDIGKHIDKPVSFSLAFAKGYSSSLSRINMTVKINLFLAKERFLKKTSTETSVSLSLIAKFKFELMVAAACFLTISAVFISGILRIIPLENEMKNIINVRSLPLGVSEDSTEKELIDINSVYKIKAKTMEDIAKKRLYLTPLLDTVPRLIPRDAWLVNIFFREDKAGPEFVLEGRAYLGNAATEKELVNAFCARLKGNAVVIKYFKEVSVVSSQHMQTEKIGVTNFTISCQSHKKGEAVK
ncbi:MAG: pilus assembly protein PilM [Candidatus Omnitrophota bacterium]